MASARGTMIGILIMILGFLVIYTFISPTFLFSIGLGIGTYNAINEQFGIWGPVIGVAIILTGLISMGRFN